MDIENASEAQDTNVNVLCKMLKELNTAEDKNRLFFDELCKTLNIVPEDSYDNYVIETEICDRYIRINKLGEPRGFTNLMKLIVFLSDELPADKKASVLVMLRGLKNLHSLIPSKLLITLKYDNYAVYIDNKYELVVPIIFLKDPVACFTFYLHNNTR
jgi:hypothetical protein